LKKTTTTNNKNKKTLQYLPQVKYTHCTLVLPTY